MNVLVIGSGGREHALVWKIRQSPRVKKVYCAPGNGGTGAIAENVSIASDDIPALVEFAKAKDIGLTVVGPDDALAAGVVDAFQEAGLKAFGPTREAARFEWSKIFAKDFMRRHGIPAAESASFASSLDAHAHARTQNYPLVIKADGLALGKGVVIAPSPADAALAIHRAMELETFGKAGKEIVIEEFLSGTECSLHALVDGTNFLLFPDCKDHKRAFDNDLGPNTGGMGTISPSGATGRDTTSAEELVRRFVEGARAEGIDFRGLLFPGLMITPSGAKVLEFNCRFGDPETQVLMRRLRSDLVDLLEATIDGRLSEAKAEWDDRVAVCVILASGGYPGDYRKGLPITGIGQAEALDDIVVFHAGTRMENEALTTHGGRVLGVTALGATPEEARRRAYEAADMIHFENLQRREDIGKPLSIASGA